MKGALQENKYRQLTMWDYPGMQIAEQGAEPEVYDTKKTSENNRANTEKRLLERIISQNNLKLAVKKVKANGGTCGIDAMPAAELYEYFETKGEQLIQTILSGKYKPQPVKRVEIPKEQKGKTRKLGIPTVVDRVIQQAITQILSPMYEPQFSEYSYGFRPGKSAHQAVVKCTEYMNSGYVNVVDMDLEKFFDTVNQSKMVELLSKEIKDGRVISLIHKYMRAGAVTGEWYTETNTGVTQGGPLSPLLSNIMLNELDRELEKRGHRYVRYADDCMILCRSRKSAERVKEGISKYIEKKLFLKVNEEKTKVLPCTEVKYLGIGFYIKDEQTQIRVHQKSVEKMKHKIRELTKRSRSISHEQWMKELNEYIRGWVNYFGIANMKRLARVTDGWLRRRIRAIHWKHWKTRRKRTEQLCKAGVTAQTARKLAYTRKGIWRIAKNPPMHRALGNEHIRTLGYLTFTEQFLKNCVT